MGEMRSWKNSTDSSYKGGRQRDDAKGLQKQPIVISSVTPVNRGVR